MTRQSIATGATANDGTGDTLRAAATKINANFVEIYQHLSGGDSNALASQITFEDNAIVFEGASTDDYETRLTVEDPTADRTITLPNQAGNVVLDTATQTLTNKTLTTPTLDTPIISGGINDSNDNEVFTITPVNSAVNYFDIKNAASGGNPIITLAGTNTNVGMNFVNKGSGAIDVKKISHTPLEMTSGSTISNQYTYIILNFGATATLTLGNGTVDGEMKIITNAGAPMNIEPTSFGQGSRVTMASQDGVTFIWSGSNWYLVGNQGEVTIIV